MKKFIFLLAGAFQFSAWAPSAVAQTSIDLIWFGDSTLAPYCSVPAASDIHLWGYGYGYEFIPGSWYAYLNFGDGTDTTVEIYAQNVWAATELFYFPPPHEYQNAGVYFTYAIVTAPDALTDTFYNPHPIMVASSCQSITGIIYYDENANCILDSNDVPINDVIVTAELGSDTVAYDYVNQQGQFAIDLPDGFVYTLRLFDEYVDGVLPICPNDWFTTISLSGSAVQQDFALECAWPDPELAIDGFVTGAGPGDSAYILITADNYSCYPVSGSIVMELDSLHSFGSSDTIPSSVAGNVVTWDYHDLYTFYGSSDNQFTYAFIQASTITNPNALMGDPTCITITINPTDNNPINNQRIMCGEIGGPFDPNHKLVSPIGWGGEANIAPATELTYTIEFQNIGTAAANDVYVRDTLDVDFDFNSLQVLGSSHTMTYNLNQDALLFSFDNIILPDSSSDPQGSKGWLKYNVTPKNNLPIGSQLTNRAGIYFDNNSPVITNRTLNTIYEPTAISSVQEVSTLNIFPNPASNECTLQLPDSFNGSVTFLDMLGNVIAHEQSSKESVTIKVADFSSGIYQVVAADGLQVSIAKLLVIRE